MVYGIGILGFICGFIAGQLLLAFMLRHRTNRDLLSDKSLKVYGLLNWVMAILGTLAFVTLYRQYYG